jgi:uncharacterized membrane protein (UPF0182 family)
LENKNLHLADEPRPWYQLLPAKAVLSKLNFLPKARLYLVLGIIAIGGCLYFSAGFLTEWIWFNSLGYGDVFITRFWAKGLVQLSIFLLAFSWYFFNLRFTLGSVRQNNHDVYSFPGPMTAYREFIVQHLPVKVLHLLFLILSVFFAMITVSRFSFSWESWLKYLYQVPFNYQDPIHGSDISFYFFTLPIIEWVLSLGKQLIWGTVPLTALIYFIFNPPQLLGWRKQHLSMGQKHLLFQVSILLFGLSLSAFIQVYQLVLTPNQLFVGASFTDIQIRMLGLKVIALSLFFLAILLLSGVKIWRPRMAMLGIIINLLLVVAFLGIGPMLVQRLVVEPNQFAREKAYIEHHLAMTRRAYGLENIQVREFPVTAFGENNDLFQSYSPTLSNIRLWDWRPLQLSYNQLQGLTYYYNFANIDIDRYQIDGDYRQVMLAAREIDLTRFQSHAQTWTNRKLRYTHGYGLVMTPVNEVTPNGLPRFFIKDIPPETTGNLQVDRPEIYFGELTEDYVIVKTKIREFDYPKGDNNAETIYEGRGGIKLNSFFIRLLCAFRFQDYKMLISNELEPDSRIIFHRQIVDRVQRIAPFLRFDEDPYLVLADGRLFWIIDGYTTSNRFPYATISPGWGNYIRNPVKIVVDAYHGTTDFYVIDPEDPLINTWERVFPGLFQSLDNLPPELKKHLRYPVDLFRIQGEVYAKYHMDNPLVFYNDEDAWRIPEEKFQAETILMDPYYTILQLGENQKEEFVLMLPFIPAREISNMVGWMAALNDEPNYGQIIVYRFFKDRHVYGPMQIESRIDQDSEISQQLTLWNQQGSRVIRGNLLVVPLRDTILYVEPIFLQSEESGIPELSRVIVVYQEQVIMTRDLTEALKNIFASATLGEKAEKGDYTEEPEDDSRETIQSLIQKANRLFQEAMSLQKDGNWAGYGETLVELERVLDLLSELTSGQ